MRQILQYSNEPVAICSLRDHKLIEVNAAFLERTGYTREEVIGRSAIDWCFWTMSRYTPVSRQELGATGAVRHRTLRYRSKGGELRFGNF